MAGDIILGYDGSDGSRAALRVAVTVAKAFDAPLTVVFGYEPTHGRDGRLQAPAREDRE